MNPNNVIESLKMNEYYQTPLFEMYYYTTKCSHLDDEKLKEQLLLCSQSDLSKSQQERFFQVRFGSVFIPMEIEFEWYSVYWYYQGIDWGLTNIEKTILFPKYDKYLNGILEGGESLHLCLGIIKPYIRRQYHNMSSWRKSSTKS